MSYPFSLKDRFVSLRAAGYSFHKISKMLGVSRPTLAKWFSQLHQQIASLEWANAQGMLAKYHLSRQAILEDHIKELDRIRKALKSKDLSKVTISVLLEMEKNREQKIAERIAELEQFANLSTAGFGKDLLTMCINDETDGAATFMKNANEEEDRLEQCEAEVNPRKARK